MVQFIATASHIPPDQAPIQVSPGETVRVGECDKVWPEFVFVLAPHGVGWVPARHLSAERPDATVTLAYDTRELAVHAGTVVDVVRDDALSGWAWCRASDGREGWVPHCSLLPVDHPACAPAARREI